MRGPFDGRMAFVPEGWCDRSLARSARDSATQKSRPVGYGLIRAGVRTDSMIGVTKFRIGKLRQKHGAQVDEKYLRNSLHPIIPYPTGRFFRGTLSQALRAWLPSACPSGTKALHPSEASH